MTEYYQSIQGVSPIGRFNTSPYSYSYPLLVRITTHWRTITGHAHASRTVHRCTCPVLITHSTIRSEPTSQQRLVWSICANSSGSTFSLRALRVIATSWAFRPQENWVWNRGWGDDRSTHRMECIDIGASIGSQYSGKGESNYVGNEQNGESLHNWWKCRWLLE